MCGIRLRVSGIPECRRRVPSTRGADQKGREGVRIYGYFQLVDQLAESEQAAGPLYPSTAAVQDDA
jgi:hypothetical protein